MKFNLPQPNCQNQRVSINSRLSKYIKKNYKTGCWEWQGGLTEKGYAQIRICGKRVYVHRLLFTYYNGPILAGMFICHSCDNPKCCNPKHLFQGTQKDNIRDMLNKNRGAKTEKIDEDTMTKIINLVNSGVSTSKIAREFNVSPITVSLRLRKIGINRKFSLRALDKKQIELIHKYNKEGVSQNEISKIVNIAKSSVWRIIHGESYKTLQNEKECSNKEF